MGLIHSRSTKEDPIVLRPSLPREAFNVHMSDKLLDALSSPLEAKSVPLKSPAIEHREWILLHRKYREGELVELERQDRLLTSLLGETEQRKRREMPCTEMENLVITCYLNNPESPLHCAHEVDNFRQCVEQAKIVATLN